MKAYEHSFESFYIFILILSPASVRIYIPLRGLPSIVSCQLGCGQTHSNLWTPTGLSQITLWQEVRRIEPVTYFIASDIVSNAEDVGIFLVKSVKKNLVTYLVSYQKSSLPVMRTKKKSPLSPICFAMRHRAQFTVSPSQNCSSSTISIKRAGGGFTHQQKNLDRQVWQKRGVGRIPLFVHITVILSAVSVLTLLPPYLSFSQPAKCAKWSQVSACPCRVNECMNNR